MPKIKTVHGTENRKVVSQKEWVSARKKLLLKEKKFSKLRDELNLERRKLPWVKVDKNYVFDSPDGKKTLADLFDGRSQLIVYHFMFGPEWNEGCPSCSFNMDHTDGALVHLAQRDVSFAAVSRAPISKIEAFKERLGWKFNWVSSYGSDFNYDYHVSFTTEQLAKARSYSTLNSWHSPARKRLESAPSTRTMTATSFTRIPPTLVEPRAL